MLCALQSRGAVAAGSGAGATLSDPLLDRMVGHWTMTGTLLGKATRPAWACFMPRG
jgi:hypothetical protein